MGNTENYALLEKLGYETPKDFSEDKDYRFFEIRKDGIFGHKCFVCMDYTGKVGYSQGEDNEKDVFLSTEELNERIKRKQKMRKIKTNDELEPGKYYICHSKMIYTNGERSKTILPEKCDEISGRKFIGTHHIWAMDDNNQALEKYDIYGPLDFAQMIEGLSDD